MVLQACPNFAAWMTSALLGFGASGCVLGVETPAAGPKLERPDAPFETPAPRPKDCAANCRWSPGYWHWDGGAYVWVAGYWEREPPEGGGW
jgi:hypothetical protein